MSGSTQNSDDQQSQANEQSNGQNSKKEFNLKVLEVVAKIFFGILTLFIAFNTYNLQEKQRKFNEIQGKIQREIEQDKNTREQTQLELNVINFGFDRLFNCPKNDEDFYKKLTLVKVLGKKFNRSIVQQSSDDKNLVILILDEVKIDIEEVKKDCPNFDKDLTTPEQALQELNKERNTAVENIKWSLFKVDIAYINSCKKKGIDVKKHLAQKLTEEGFKPYAIKRYTDQQLKSSYWSNFFEQETNKVNQVIYQKAPIDETKAAERLKNLLEPLPLPNIQLKEEKPYENIPFTDPKTGEKIQIITIAIGNCN